MRKLFRAGILSFAVLAAAPFTALATQMAAHADIIPDCNGDGSCYISEDMGSGGCQADIFPSGSFAYGAFSDQNTGYTCAFWVERDVNGTGWYRISPVYDLPSPNGYGQTQNYWNGPGYRARVCLQFIWSSTSSGAVHCSPSIGS